MEKQVYSFQGGLVKKANKRWCSCEYEITFDEQAMVLPVQDDGACPQMTFRFTLLADLEARQVDSSVDVAAIIVAKGEATDVPLKKGGVKKRLNLTLLDDSGATCRLTLWGEHADTPWRVGCVTLVKGLKVSDFGGRSLNTSFATAMQVEAEARACHPRAAELARWYSAQGSVAKQRAKALSMERGGAWGPPQTLEEVKAAALTLELCADKDAFPTAAGGGPWPDSVTYHTVLPATITRVPHERPPFYLACPFEVPDERTGPGKTRTCNKKTERTGDEFMCSAGHCCQHPVPRFLAQFTLSDHTSTLECSAFDEVGKQILGCDAATVAELWERKGKDPVAQAQLEQLFSTATCTRWRVRLRSKKETWQDAETVRIQAVDCKALDVVSVYKQKLAEVMRSVG